MRTGLFLQRNYILPFIAAAFVVYGCFSFFMRNRTEGVLPEKEQIDRIGVAKETLQDELYQVISSLQLNPRKPFDIRPYKRTNSNSSVDYNFGRLSTDLILEGYRGISGGSNTHDSIEYISKGNRIQGLQMAIEALDEARDMILE